MADDSTPIYRPAELELPLRQGEILSDLRRYRIEPATVVAESPLLIEVRYPFVVVLTQDCDVTQQGLPDPGSDPHLPCVLLAEVTTATRLRGQSDINTDAWKMIRQNREERYHFLEAIIKECDAAGLGLEELALDFKRYLAVPTDELYALVNAGHVRRRCVLNTPYMEHLCNRFGDTSAGSPCHARTLARPSMPSPNEPPHRLDRLPIRLRCIVHPRGPASSTTIDPKLPGMPGTSRSGNFSSASGRRSV